MKTKQSLKRATKKELARLQKDDSKKSRFDIVKGMSKAEMISVGLTI